MIRSMILHGLVVMTIVALAISPLLAAMVAGAIAGRYGCDLDEGSIHPCIVNGQDIGGTLYTLGMMGWFALGTIPLGVIAVAMYIAGVALFYLARGLLRRRRRAAA